MFIIWRKNYRERVFSSMYVDIKDYFTRLINIFSNVQCLSIQQEKLQQLISDSSEKTMIMIMGEFNAGKSTFINALLGTELLVSDVTPATAMNTMLRYGDTFQSFIVYKNGTKEKIQQSELELLSAEGDEASAYLRKKIDHLIVEIPNNALENLTIIDSPGLGAKIDEHTNATLRFIKRADDIIWVFRYGKVGKQSELNMLERIKQEGIVPLGVVNGIDFHDDFGGDEDLEEYLEKEKRKLKSITRDLIGVSSIEALESALENDKEKWEWSNFEQLQQNLQQIASDPLFKEKHILNRINEFFQELYHEILKNMIEDKYNEQVETIVKFIEIKQNNVYKKRDEVRNNIDDLTMKMEEWNIFPEKINSLRGLKIILENSVLNNNVRSLIHHIDHLFSLIQSYEKSINDYNNSIELAKDYHSKYVGNGLMRVKQLFVKKENLNIINNQLNLLKKKNSQCSELEKKISRQETALQTFLEHSINTMEKEIIHNRKQLYEQIQIKKSEFLNKVEHEYTQINPSIWIIQKYGFIDRLQEETQNHIIPLFKKWKEQNPQLIGIIEEIEANLLQIQSINTSSYLIDSINEIFTSLNQISVDISNSYNLPYNLKEQISFSITNEFKPSVVEEVGFNTWYLRPFTMTVLTTLFIIYLFTSGITSKLLAITGQATDWVALSLNEVKKDDTNVNKEVIGKVRVNVEQINIRNGPGINSTVVDIAKYGDTFKVFEKQGIWLRIGKNKWISGKSSYSKFKKID